jgi:hypothetical protein
MITIERGYVERPLRYRSKRKSLRSARLRGLVHCEVNYVSASGAKLLRRPMLRVGRVKNLPETAVHV